MKIEVEESALDAIAAMGKRLQEERDELLDTLKLMKYDVEQNVYCYDELSSYRLANSLIAKCTAEPDIMECKQ